MLKSRGYLPHWDIPGATQFLTWRLDDSIPSDEWERWRAERMGNIGDDHRRIEGVLDRHLGNAWLRRPDVSWTVLRTIFEEEAEGNVIQAAVVMPNHVHVVLSLGDPSGLGRCVNRMKGRAARLVNAAHRRQGRLWQADYFDRLIRDQEHFARCVEYVHWNPVKAGLCEDPSRFPASTANREALDLRDAMRRSRELERGL